MAARGQLGWRTELGVGLIVNPENVGGDDYNITPIPYFDFRFFDERGTKYFANVPQGIGGYFYRRRDPDGGFFNLGAGIAPGFNVRDDSIPGIEEIGVSVEARVYLEAGARKWSAGATLAQDVGSGHEGAYLDLSLSRRGSIGRPGGFYAVGPVLRIGDDTYKSAFFNVGAQQPPNPDFPAYTADAGVERVGLQGLMSVPVGASKWRWTSIVRASQLIGDAADSPIVTEETQLFFLTSFTRSF
jgi:outer membrane protein